MLFFQKIKDHSSLNKAQEEAFYEKVYEEYEHSPKRKGLWAQALIKAGESGNVDVIYLKLLAEAMKNDTYLIKRIIESTNSKVENESSVIQDDSESNSYISFSDLEKRKHFSKAQLIPRIASGEVNGYKLNGEWYLDRQYAENLSNK